MKHFKIKAALTAIALSSAVAIPTAPSASASGQPVHVYVSGLTTMDFSTSEVHPPNYNVTLTPGHSADNVHYFWSYAQVGGWCLYYRGYNNATGQKTGWGRQSEPTGVNVFQPFPAGINGVGTYNYEVQLEFRDYGVCTTH